MPRRPPLPILHVTQRHIDTVLSLLRERGIEVEVEEVQNKPGGLRLQFGPLPDSVLFKLIGTIPEEAHAYCAVVGDRLAPRTP